MQVKEVSFMKISEMSDRVIARNGCIILMTVCNLLSAISRQYAVELTSFALLYLLAASILAISKEVPLWRRFIPLACSIAAVVIAYHSYQRHLGY
jgi:hypothetical protein